MLKLNLANILTFLLYEYVAYNIQYPITDRKYQKFTISYTKKCGHVETAVHECCTK